MSYTVIYTSDQLIYSSSTVIIVVIAIIIYLLFNNSKKIFEGGAFSIPTNNILPPNFTL